MGCSKFNLPSIVPHALCDGKGLESSSLPSNYREDGKESPGHFSHEMKYLSHYFGQ